MKFVFCNSSFIKKVYNLFMIIDKREIKYKNIILQSKFKHNKSSNFEKAIFFIGPIYANYENNWGFLDLFTNDLFSWTGLPVYSYEFFSLPLDDLKNRKMVELSSVNSQYEITKMAFEQFIALSNAKEVILISQSFGSNSLLNLLRSELKVKHKAIFLAPVFESFLHTHYFKEIEETNNDLIKQYREIANTDLKIRNDLEVINIGAAADAKMFKQDYINFGAINSLNKNFKSISIPNSDHGWNFLEMLDNNFKEKSAAWIELFENIKLHV